MLAHWSAIVYRDRNRKPLEGFYCLSKKLHHSLSPTLFIPFEMTTEGSVAAIPHFVFETAGEPEGLSGKYL